MSQGDEAAANYARKGKRIMNEGPSEPTIPSPQPTSSQRANMQRLLNATAPMRPFSSSSYVPRLEPEPFSDDSLLRRPEPAPINFPNSFLPTTHHQLDQIVTRHNQNLKNAVYAMVEKQVEELAEKKIEDKIEEIRVKMTECIALEYDIKLYRKRIAQLLPSETNWQVTIDFLRKKLKEANVPVVNVDTGEEEDEDELSYEELTKMINIMMVRCRICEKLLATIMFWPCRHVCVCKECKSSTEVCPMCDMEMLSTQEVCIPTYYP